VPLRAVNAEGERPIFSLDSWLERRGARSGHEAKSKESSSRSETKDESPLTYATCFA